VFPRCTCDAAPLFFGGGVGIWNLDLEGFGIWNLEFLGLKYTGNGTISILPCPNESNGTQVLLQLSKQRQQSFKPWVLTVLPVHCAFLAPQTDTPSFLPPFPITSTLFISRLLAPEIPAIAQRTSSSASSRASMLWL
jgi:hypothetical protein